MLKSSIRKIYITLCATGDVDKLNDFITRNPTVIQYLNPDSKENGLFYSIRNLRTDATKYLLKKEFSISNGSIRNLIGSHWRGSLESYLFLKEFGTSIYESNYPSEYENWLFETYIDFCFSNHNLRKLFRILNAEGKMSKENIELFLERYKSSTVNKSNRNYIANIRELQLTLLLTD